MLIVEKIPFKFYDKEGVDTFEIELGTLEIQCPKDGSFIVDGNEMSAEEIKVLFKGE
jgi:hypothetical protein